MLYTVFCHKQDKNLIVPRKDWPTADTQKINSYSKVMALKTLKDVVKVEDLELVRRGYFGHLLDMPFNNFTT